MITLINGSETRFVWFAASVIALALKHYGHPFRLQNRAIGKFCFLAIPQFSLSILAFPLVRQDMP